MTDPLDLEALKKRAREISGRYSAESVVEMEGLCARAIEIADQSIRERDEIAADALEEAGETGGTIGRLMSERDQAVRDVLRLRLSLHNLVGLAGQSTGAHKALEATDHYEQHRQTQEGAPSE